MNYFGIFGIYQVLKYVKHIYTCKSEVSLPFSMWKPYVCLVWKCCFITTESVFCSCAAYGTIAGPPGENGPRGERGYPGPRGERGTLKQSRWIATSFQNKSFLEEWHRWAKSESFGMFSGDPGHPGLSGLPGAYTVQVPHRVQKRDAGTFGWILFYHFKIKCYIHVTAYFNPLQAMKWLLVVVRSFAVT